jgi:hypothetical protein
MTQLTEQSPGPLQQVLEGYTNGREIDLPLAGYLTLMGGFAVVFGTLLAELARKAGSHGELGATDVLLMGVGTHKLSRLITKEKVTIPLRAPFTELESLGADVKEKPRGGVLRRAVGQLITCPFCMGPWIASAFAACLTVSPRPTRFALKVLTAVTISDLMHHGYAKVRKLT